MATYYVHRESGVDPWIVAIDWATEASEASGVLHSVPAAGNVRETVKADGTGSLYTITIKGY